MYKRQPLDRALAYVTDAQQVAKGQKTPARAHVDRGTQVSAELIAFTATGLKALDGVLAERIAAAEAGTYLRGLYAVSCGTRQLYLTAAAALNG